MVWHHRLASGINSTGGLHTVISPASFTRRFQYSKRIRPWRTIKRFTAKVSFFSHFVIVFLYTLTNNQPFHYQGVLVFCPFVIVLLYTLTNNQPFHYQGVLVFCPLIDLTPVRNRCNSRAGGEPFGRARRPVRSVVGGERIFRRRCTYNQSLETGTDSHARPLSQSGPAFFCVITSTSVMHVLFLRHARRDRASELKQSYMKGKKRATFTFQWPKTVKFP